MSESVAEVLATDPDSFIERNLSACDVLIHAQDFLSYIAKQHGLDNYADCYLFVHSQIKEIIKKMRACQIRPLFVVDGTVSPRGSISESRIICELLSASDVSYAVSRSNAVPTCLALSCMLGFPILGSNCNFYLYSFPSLKCRDIFSKPLIEPTFVPIECLQHLNSESLHLRSNVYNAIGCRRTKCVPTNQRPLLSLMMELISFPQSANKNLELDFIARWLYAAGSLAVLRHIMQTALSYDDPCLVLQSVTEYLISLTPDFEEAIALLPYLGLNGDDFHLPEICQLEPDSPQFFLNFAMDIIDGRPFHHFRVEISDHTLLDLFHRGQIDALTMSTDSNSCPPVHLLRCLQHSTLANHISINHPWSYLEKFFNFSTTFPLNEEFSAVMLCCLLWGSNSTDFCYAIELSPVILSTVLCALTGMLCKRAAVVFSTMLEHFEPKRLRQSSLEEDYFRQALEVLQIYSEFLSFCNICKGSGASKITLWKEVHFDPLFIVFPCLRLSALIAAKLHSCAPEKRLLELISSPFLNTLKADTPNLLSLFCQFMSIIKTAKFKVPDPKVAVKSLHICECKVTNNLGDLKDLRSGTSISPVSPREQTRLGEQQPSGSLVSISNSPRNRTYRIRKEGYEPSSGKNSATRSNCGRPKTPPPASAFMKSGRSSGYAARLAQRYADRLN